MRIIEEIGKEVTEVIERVKEEQIAHFVEQIDKNRTVFLSGEGRSLLVGKCFMMRLVHLGYHPYVIGETNTPVMRKNDQFIAVSGSGESGSVLLEAKKAKKAGCEVFVITCKEASTLAKMADHLLIIPGTVKSDTNRSSIQLLSSLFDQSLHLVLDAIALMLSYKDHFSNEAATSNHYQSL